MLRYLGLSVAEAEQLPWWEYQMYLEQLLEDKPWYTYSVMVEPPEEEEQAGGDLASLAGLGLSTRQVG